MRLVCPCVVFQLRAVLCPDSTGSRSSSTEYPLYWPKNTKDETEGATINPPASLNLELHIHQGDSTVNKEVATEWLRELSKYFSY